ncbi:hypothetical protein [Niallia sp. Krafla_26]|uniref:hypothetical protein n=1 Tax=Niallia sp. Krafla_26 TaxID=3064703 RepID=UPI003D16B93A
MGFIFQDYNLIETLNIKENIILPLSLANVPPHEIEKRLKMVVESLVYIEAIIHTKRR